MTIHWLLQLSGHRGEEMQKKWEKTEHAEQGKRQKWNVYLIPYQVKQIKYDLVWFN